MSYLVKFLNDEQAQDLVEYTLLLAVVALAAGAAYVGMAPQISAIVSKRNNDLVCADQFAQ